MMSMASPCNPAPDAPNGFRAVVIDNGTMAVVIADNISVKLAQPKPLLCTVMLLANGTIVAEDRERMGGWHGCVIWAPKGSYCDEDVNQTTASPDT